MRISDLFREEIKLEKILVFKTSTDTTIMKLFYDLGRADIDCLIQSDQINRCQAKYPYINFIDIGSEGVYNLPFDVIHLISQKFYDQVYVTFTGTKGHNYGNVMELISRVNFKSAFFYNCDGDKSEIPRKNVIKDTICRLYIKGIEFIYGLRSE